MDNTKRPGEVYSSNGTLSTPLYPSLSDPDTFSHCCDSVCGGSQCLYNKWRGFLRLGSDTRALLGWGSLKDQVSLSRRKVIIFGFVVVSPLTAASFIFAMYMSSQVFSVQI
jgi:hypothetical protein